MAVTSTKITRRLVETPVLKVDTINSDVTFNSNVQLASGKTISIDEMSGGEISIGTLKNNGAVSISNIASGNEGLVVSSLSGTASVDSIKGTGELYARLSGGTAYLNSSASETGSGTIYIRCDGSSNYNIDTGTINIGNVTANGMLYGLVNVNSLNGGIIRLSSIDDGSLTINSITGGSATISSITGGSATITTSSPRKTSSTPGDQGGAVAAYLTVKPAHNLIYQWSGEATKSIILGAHFFLENHIYYIWLSDSGGDDGEYGYFIRPKEGRYTTLSMYKGSAGGSDGDAGWNIAVRAMKGTHYDKKADYNTTFSECSQLQFRRIYHFNAPWYSTGNNPGTIETHNKFTKMKIWDLGVKLDLSDYA